MRCPQCHQVLSDDAEACPQCGWQVPVAAESSQREDDMADPEAPDEKRDESEAAEDEAKGPEAGAPEGEAPEAPEKATVEPVELAFNGAMAGVLYGAATGVVIMVLGWLAGGVEAYASPWPALALGLVMGAGAGAIVGIVTVLTHSIPGGIMTGIVVEALLKLMAMGSVGLWWGVSGPGVVASIAAGVVFGAVVAPMVYRAIDWESIDLSEFIEG
ncbi:MAG: zinc ribbon domain-containing protein [Armatimonadota bacterium]|nr:zinc ribbon domain-containing protein [Armatimonadota bacterium]